MTTLMFLGALFDDETKALVTAIGQYPVLVFSAYLFRSAMLAWRGKEMVQALDARSDRALRILIWAVPSIWRSLLATALVLGWFYIQHWR